MLIRWGLQRYPHSLISIPKSVNASRIAQNGDVLGWELPAEAMGALNKLDCDFRNFISYMKTPENECTWHDGVLEKGDDSDFVTRGA